jgi:Bacterial Ig domain
MSETKRRQSAGDARVTSRLQPTWELAQPGAEVTVPRPTPLTWSLAAASALCVGAMVGASILSIHGCRVSPIRLALGDHQNISIALPANTPCTISVQPASTMLDDITVDAPAAHGTLTPRGRTGVTYRPRAGFRGSDSFDFSLHSGSNAGRESSVIRVRATIE